MKRRNFLIAGTVIPLGLKTVPALATPSEAQEAMLKITGGAAILDGKVHLDLPPLVENGNSVTVTITVDSPMTATHHVKAIHLFAEKNPQPYVASFRLGPRAGRASITTRIRLADSQTVWAIGEMSDGSFWSGKAESVVTFASCTEVI